MQEGSFTDIRKLAREFSGFFLIFWGLFVLLSLVTHWPMDPSLNHVTSKSSVVQNYAGLLGAYISGFLSDVFGIAAYVWPVVFGAVGVACIAPRYELLWWRWLGYFLLTLCLLFVGAAWNIELGQIHGGGMVGNTLFQHAIRFLSPWGSWILWLFLFTMATQLTFGISWANIYRKAHVFCKQRLRELPLLALPQNTAPKAEAQPDSHLQNTVHPPAQAPLSMEAPTNASNEAQPPRQSWLTKFPRFSFKRKTQQNETHAEPAAQVSNSITWGFALKNFLHTLKEKMGTRQNVTPMPEVYDIEAIHIDDPNITIVPASSYSTDAQYVEKEQVPTVQAEMAERAHMPAPPSEAKASTVSAAHAPHYAADQRPAPQPQQAPVQSSESSQGSARMAPSASAVVPPSIAPEKTPSVKEREEVAEKERELFSAQKQERVTTPSTPPAAAMPAPSNIEIVSSEPPVAPKPAPVAPRTPAVPRKYTFPPLSLLQEGAPSSPKAHDVQIQRGQALMSCLSDFSIQGELVRITPGPVVTMYEVRPAAGIRVNKIANLTDDIALALKAIAIRIQAPIPGSDTVGIEIPNMDREMVNFREVLESSEFTNAGGPLNMVLGKNIAGHPFVAELSKMPHLLVAGATGAGKSVGLNAILLSLLYTTQPEDMQLLLIDPKRIEMAVYADLPHLVHPVVTEMQHAKTALEWAVHEMDKRYESMAKLQVRNISGFNQKVKSFAELPPEEVPAELAEMEHMPYLVIIIDELADLMLTAAREVETSIVRLAQLARAAGIHMILATQRPSVDVVTGIIKANFPCRISFQVTSKHDSRTILDMVGAEHLLGKGDMLYKPSGGRLMRLHGPFVPDEEVQAVVAHWKKQAPPAYKVDFSQWGNEQNDGKSGAFSDMSNDPLYAEVRAFVEEQGKVSISLVQRRFKIGFNKAAVMVEQLEHDGIIGPADGSKPRTIIR